MRRNTGGRKKNNGNLTNALNAGRWAAISYIQHPVQIRKSKPEPYCTSHVKDENSQGHHT